MNSSITKYKKQTAIFILILLLILASLLLYYYNGKKKGTVSLETTAFPKYQSYAEKTNLPLSVNAMGSIIPHISTILGAEVAGQINKIYVQQGQIVRENELLADIVNKTYLAELNRARQESEGLKAQLNQRKDLYERIDRLLKKDAATTIEWEKAKSDYISAVAQFDASNEQIKALLERYNKTKIIAPYEGIIGKKMIEEGDFVSPGSPLFIVYTTGPMDVEFDVPERYISNLHIGDQVTASIELSKVDTTATIYQIIPYEEIKSRSFRVKAHINDYNTILSGAFVRVRFLVGEQISILIPIQAVEKVGHLEMVKVFEGGIWNRRYIRTGDRFDDKIEVISGLKGGEVIGYD